MNLIATTRNQGTSRRIPPARTADDRELQVVSLAIDLAEKQIRAGTAKASTINHFLKIGSSKERMEKELLEKEIELKRAKTEAIQSQKQIEKLYSEALSAMKRYSGDDYDDYDDYDD